MIDLHNHILSDVDDGAGSIEESLAIARTFVSEGVHIVVATPHVDLLRRTGPHRDEIEGRVAALSEALAAADIPLQVLAGSEVFLTPDVVDCLQSGTALALAGSNAVLVESGFGTRPPYLDESLNGLIAAGYIPVLAHPERYPWMASANEPAEALIERGVVLQLTAPGLLGEYGSRVKRTAERLLRGGLYALAGSDRHHPSGRRSLRDLRARIAALAGDETGRLLLEVNPGRLLGREPLATPCPVERQSSFLERLFGGV